jgi:hypothetical protein
MKTKLSDKMKAYRGEYVGAVAKCTKFALLASCYTMISMPIAFAYMHDLATTKRGKKGEDKDSK